MKTVLLCVGKTKDSLMSEGISLYTKRVQRYMPFDVVALPDVKTTKGITEARQKETEGAAILNFIDNRDFVVLLDERGKEMTSREFSSFIEKKSVTVAGNLIFVIGGPYGFSKEVYDRADDKLSLSKMTFNHEMVRLFFAEQVYRAMTILRGEPYHHE